MAMLTIQGRKYDVTHLDEAVSELSRGRKAALAQVKGHPLDQRLVIPTGSANDILAINMHLWVSMSDNTARLNLSMMEEHSFPGYREAGWREGDGVIIVDLGTGHPPISTKLFSMQQEVWLWNTTNAWAYIGRQIDEAISFRTSLKERLTALGMTCIGVSGNPILSVNNGEGVVRLEFESYLEDREAKYMATPMVRWLATPLTTPVCDETLSEFQMWTKSLNSIYGDLNSIYGDIDSILVSFATDTLPKLLGGRTEAFSALPRQYRDWLVKGEAAIC